MKPIAWNGIHFSLPDDWELLQFSKNADKGRLVFGDRYQYRFELDWAVITLPPDLDRMAKDYKAKLTTDGVLEARTIDHAPWRGVTGIEDGAQTSRYCAYFDNRTYLLEAIFLWPEQQPQKHSPQFEAKILDTIRVTPFQDDQRQVWSAFGINCIAPEKHRLDDCANYPADVKLTFTDERETETETVARAGFLKIWLKNGVDEWLKTTIPKDYKLLEINHTQKDGHDIWSVEATVRQAVLKDWLKGRRYFYAAAWICPHDNRLYTVTKSARQYRNGTPHLPISLSCCSDLEITL